MKNETKSAKKFKVALICGGPSLERGISLNSARSVMDHMPSERIEIVPIYLDQKKRAYQISRAQLYSNTPSDFDFKLKTDARSLTEKQFVHALKRCHLTFPVMHGPYGDDGGIQRFLEKHRIRFVGSGSSNCKLAFDKYTGNEHLKTHGFFTLPSALLKIYATDHERTIRRFFEEHAISRAVVKPASGGSSIGVFSVSTPQEALEKARLIFSKRMDTRVVIEQFAEGKEFTVIILQSRFGIPVALPPTEIETDYTEHQIFDFRKKYLPTRHVTYHSPPRFADADIERIQAQAEQLFALFGLHDFARFDGWILPSGEIWFNDFNPISGMEQNSFLFQQGARVGLSHADVLRFVIGSAARRYGLCMPEEKRAADTKRKPVAVLFGGAASERQVSLMSGTNVWLKLRNSRTYEPHPYLLDADGKTIWKLPYHLTLNHTVEEIGYNCRNYPSAKKRLEEYETRARLHLGFSADKDTTDFFDPEALSLDELLGRYAFVFNALHGGMGEDGTLQGLFARRGVRSNGTDESTSRLCMDKWATAESVRELKLSDVEAIPGIIEDTRAFQNAQYDARAHWKMMLMQLGGDSVIVKPRGDGCSTGVVHLYSPRDLTHYVEAIREKVAHIRKGTFRNQTEIIDMPPVTPTHLIFERFVETDVLRVINDRLKHKKQSGWAEITIGVIEMGHGLHALNPSITIAEGEVLSVEEKFQGGTGVNLTPPPAQIMKPIVVQRIRSRIETLASRMGIRGYSRIDAFAHLKTGDLQIIEVNTLPGLTPSTVLYHQGLAEEKPLYPRDLLEILIANKGY